jgi:hypothetical protein
MWCTSTLVRRGGISPDHLKGPNDANEVLNRFAQ